MVGSEPHEEEFGMVWRCAAAMVIGMATAGAANAAEGNAKAGETVFKKCSACHTVTKPPKHGIGPSLVGVMGRKVGTAEGFKYSDAMKNATVVWDEKAIDDYMKDPKNFIPKNKMVFVGLPKDVERADLIAYLKEAAK
jgi:cytochrome c